MVIPTKGGVSLLTHILVFSVPYHPGYLVRCTTPPWNHPLWCDDLRLSGAYMCFPTQRILFCFPEPYFLSKNHIIFVGLFIKICNTPPCSLKYYCNIWLYSTLTEAESNGKFPPPEPAPGWEKHKVPWIPFVSQLLSIQITIGCGTWSTDFSLWVGKETYLHLGLF